MMKTSVVKTLIVTVVRHDNTHLSIIPEFRNLAKEDLQFKPSLGYIETLSQKKAAPGLCDIAHNKVLASCARGPGVHKVLFNSQSHRNHVRQNGKLLVQNGANVSYMPQGVVEEGGD
jgi:hypothetical protein